MTASATAFDRGRQQDPSQSRPAVPAGIPVHRQQQGRQNELSLPEGVHLQRSPGDVARPARNEGRQHDPPSPSMGQLEGAALHRQQGRQQEPPSPSMGPRPPQLEGAALHRPQGRPPPELTGQQPWSSPEIEETYTYPIADALWAEVIADFEPVGDTVGSQMRLTKGEIVYVLERHSSGWWGGHKDGSEMTAWFPKAHIRPLNEDGVLDNGEDDSLCKACRDVAGAMSPKQGRETRPPGTLTPANDSRRGSAEEQAALIERYEEEVKRLMRDKASERRSAEDAMIELDHSRAMAKDIQTKLHEEQNRVAELNDELEQWRRLRLDWQKERQRLLDDLRRKDLRIRSLESNDPANGRRTLDCIRQSAQPSSAVRTTSAAHTPPPNRECNKAGMQPAQRASPQRFTPQNRSTPSPVRGEVGLLRANREMSAGRAPSPSSGTQPSMDKSRIPSPLNSTEQTMQAMSPYNGSTVPTLPQTAGMPAASGNVSTVSSTSLPTGSVPMVAPPTGRRTTSQQHPSGAPASGSSISATPGGPTTPNSYTQPVRPPTPGWTPSMSTSAGAPRPPSPRPWAMGAALNSGRESPGMGGCSDGVDSGALTRTTVMSPYDHRGADPSPTRQPYTACHGGQSAMVVTPPPAGGSNTFARSRAGSRELRPQVACRNGTFRGNGMEQMADGSDNMQHGPTQRGEDSSPPPIVFGMSPVSRGAVGQQHSIRSGLPASRGNSPSASGGPSVQDRIRQLYGRSER
eukprot:TRINITY_DN56979_c0_g1_i1.p1 TRINITY_DN56979_c0_g1~~TRINITY_DN56979_c0_g1_i1.p1  ORF type:complete len:765 (-),score=105.25 TRINITY_DN56979_c0_g1_i1:367-2598(-)